MRAFSPSSSVGQCKSHRSICPRQVALSYAPLSVSSCLWRVLALLSVSSCLARSCSSSSRLTLLETTYRSAHHIVFHKTAMNKRWKSPVVVAAAYTASLSCDFGFVLLVRRVFLVYTPPFLRGRCSIVVPYYTGSRILYQTFLYLTSGHSQYIFSSSLSPPRCPSGTGEAYFHSRLATVNLLTA